MNESVCNLTPRCLWTQFAALNAHPRPSKHEQQVRQFMVDFGQRLGLEPEVDAVGNVLIRKPATPGMEDRQIVALQGHLDMVHQKNADTAFDFATQGIEMLVDGDWVKAKGTTLGADNGIGVAAIMAVLASTDLPHPPLEALLTIDEETGMTGAKGLQPGVLRASILLNLDTEVDTELTIGCAGGVDVSAVGGYPQRPAGTGRQGLRLTVRGLTGGHSGMDIQLGRGNANKLLNRLLLLATEEFDAELSRFDGGGLRNAIPREATAALAVASQSLPELTRRLDALSGAIRAEHRTTDPALVLEQEAIACPAQVCEAAAQRQLLRAIAACPNGVFRMSPDMPALVQTSNNLARMLAEDGKYEVLCLTRGAVESEKLALAESIRAAFSLIGADVQLSGMYQGWTPAPQAAIVTLMREVYEQLFGEPPHVTACHGGLECGILGAHYPQLEMISFGPNICGAHSPDEQVQISSVQKFWRFFCETLARTPRA